MFVKQAGGEQTGGGGLSREAGKPRKTERKKYKNTAHNQNRMKIQGNPANVSPC